MTLGLQGLEADTPGEQLLHPGDPGFGDLGAVDGVQLGLRPADPLTAHAAGLPALIQGAERLIN